MSSRASRSSGSCSCRPVRAPTSARRSAARGARRSSARWARRRCSARSRPRSPRCSPSPRSAWPCWAASAAALSCARPRRPRSPRRPRGRRRPAPRRLPRRRERRGSVTPGAPLARLALILALGLAGCGGEADSAIDHAPASEKPAYGDTFIEALIGNISGLIPNVLSDSASFEVGSLLYSGLVTRDRDLNLIGELAESWRFSKDCLDLTLHLRRNVRWHDDAPFTAADVVFTYETMINPKTPTAYREDFRAVASVEAVDPYTLHVRYKQPYAKALQSWGVWMLPKHVLEPYVREGRLREAPQNRSNPVGTGAYRFKEWKPGEKVVLVANPDYFEGRPHISRVVYRIIPSEATGPYKPGTWAYNPNVRTHAYDMDKARALLADAGWKERNADGVLVRNGQPFVFELLTNQGNDERKKVAEIVQASLKELGVQV